MERPYKTYNESIICDSRLNAMSVARLREEYVKLGELLVLHRKYCTSLHIRIRNHQTLWRTRKRRSSAKFRRKVHKIAYIRKSIRAQDRNYQKKLRKRIRREYIIKNRKVVSARYAKWKTRIPARINKLRKRVYELNKIRLKKSRKAIRRQLSKRTRRAIFKATALAKENTFIGLVKKERNPSIGRYAGVYALVMKQVSQALEVPFADICYMLWFGSFESFNVSTLCVMYPAIPRNRIRLKVGKFQSLGYLQYIGKFRGRNNYAHTPVGKEYYNRILRYMKRMRKPYSNVRISKRMLRTHFKKPFIANR